MNRGGREGPNVAINPCPPAKDHPLFPKWTAFSQSEYVTKRRPVCSILNTLRGPRISPDCRSLSGAPRGKISIAVSRAEATSGDVHRRFAVWQIVFPFLFDRRWNVLTLWIPASERKKTTAICSGLDTSVAVERRPFENLARRCHTSSVRRRSSPK